MHQLPRIDHAAATHNHLDYVTQRCVTTICHTTLHHITLSHALLHNIMSHNAVSRYSRNAMSHKAAVTDARRINKSIAKTNNI